MFGCANSRVLLILIHKKLFFNVLNGDFRLVAAPLIILHARARAAAAAAASDGRDVFHLDGEEKSV